MKEHIQPNYFLVDGGIIGFVILAVCEIRAATRRYWTRFAAFIFCEGNLRKTSHTYLLDRGKVLTLESFLLGSARRYLSREKTNNDQWSMNDNFGCFILWHINHCRQFNAKSFFIQKKTVLYKTILFMINIVFFCLNMAKCKTVLFQTIQFSINTLFKDQKQFYFNLFSLVNRVKCFQVLLCMTNSSMKHQSFIYTLLDLKTVHLSRSTQFKFQNSSISNYLV